MQIRKLKETTRKKGGRAGESGAASKRPIEYREGRLKVVNTHTKRPDETSQWRARSKGTYVNPKETHLGK